MPNNRAPKYSIGVVSLGCSKNRVDSEQMLGLLQAAGHTIVNDPTRAEVIVINTCGFIESAKQESIDTILEYAQYKAKGSCKLLVVTGCLSQRYHEALRKELPEVDILLGVHEYASLPGLLAGSNDIAPAAPRLLSTPAHSAYLRIADGCDNRCAYCAIPLIRGPLHSVPMEALLQEAQGLLAGGVTELTLIAQDTSGYGVDLYGKPMLLPLMQQLTELPSLHWLRVLYTYPETVTPKLIEAIAGNPKICNYLDMPLQHISDGVLRRMNRRGNRAHVESVLQAIRKDAPDFILRTTMMVGFPGETDRDFEELMAFLRDYPFDRLGTFAFSPEEDTAAASMPMQIPDERKAQRLDALMRQQQALSEARNARRLGQTAEMLIEKMEDAVSFGRTYAEAPEVDGAIQVARAPHHKIGAYIHVRLTQTMGAYDIMGEEMHESAE